MSEDIPLDAEDKDQFWLLFDVEGAVLSAQSSKSDLLSLCVAIFLDIGFGALEDDTTFFLVRLFGPRLVQAHGNNAGLIWILELLSPERWLTKRQH